MIGVLMAYTMAQAVGLGLPVSGASDYIKGNQAITPTPNYNAPPPASNQSQTQNQGQVWATTSSQNKPAAASLQQTFVQKAPASYTPSPIKPQTLGAAVGTMGTIQSIQKPIEQKITPTMSATYPLQVAYKQMPDTTGRGVVTYEKQIVNPNPAGMTAKTYQPTYNEQFIAAYGSTPIVQKYAVFPTKEQPQGKIIETGGASGAVYPLSVMGSLLMPQPDRTIKENWANRGIPMTAAEASKFVPVMKEWSQKKGANAIETFPYLKPITPAPQKDIDAHDFVQAYSSKPDSSQKVYPGTVMGSILGITKTGVDTPKTVLEGIPMNKTATTRLVAEMKPWAQGMGKPALEQFQYLRQVPTAVAKMGASMTMKPSMLETPKLGVTTAAKAIGVGIRPEMTRESNNTLSRLTPRINVGMGLNRSK